MPKPRNYKKHTVTARVQILDLTKAGSSMELEIFANQEKLGTIILGRGSLTWRGGRRQRDKRISWSKFAEMMDEYSYGE
jgi:acetyl-CoA carboxylase carboxyltransferase component